MARVFITGSTDGLGLAAAQSLLGDGHDVVLHARSKDRAAQALATVIGAPSVVIGDLASQEETRSIAEQVNALGRMDAVIHNAGIYTTPNRGSTPDGHATILAVNTLAPYILTALIEPPGRLVYGGRVFVSLGGGGCLHCHGVLDPDQVRAYFAGEEEQQRREKAYGIDAAVLDDKGPSVSPVNGVVASLGAVEFMAAVTGLREPKRHIVYRGDQGRVGNVNDPGKPNCYYCEAQYGRDTAADVERYLREKHLR